LAWSSGADLPLAARCLSALCRSWVQGPVGAVRVVQCGGLLEQVLRAGIGQAAAPAGGVDVGRRLRIPINHFEGNYTCDEATLRQLVDEDRIVLRYVDNPNGSIDGIAGVCNAARNVVGLMPHPERASDPLVGSVDGAELLTSLLLSALTAASAPVA